ncbi:SDR family NAD(P)-dependent oxidoreductase [Candidatus Uabimicrobium amorphum]|uniref:3-oxoacyl-ACP reductase n=1 Tax=Uabimicrobium amorphum TaxID=2596890 RepID=A0A5S9IRH7_UABAM|nr:SDR family NAD(P)-dependent oxidoreductase [Candidatus Uabimicrobium amorphum]BBM86387.1 3-oxoacyl-ACP reductase [Candidatus Uabimicrobium amorphum]
MAKNKHALITGGSSGLGLAMARQLAKEGMQVTIVGRNPQKLKKAVEELHKIHEEIYGVVADISSSQSIQSIVSHVKEQGSVDFLIMNAGVVHVGTLAQMSESELRADIDIDLTGTMLCTKHLLPFLTKDARILFVSSVLGFLAMAGYPAYCPAKAGVIHFAAVLRRELKNTKMCVYVACPADIDTPQYDYEFASMPEWMKGDGARPNVMTAAQAATKILRKCHGGRWLITINFEVWLLLTLSKILPQRIVDFILDRMFPVPSVEDVLADEEVKK